MSFFEISPGLAPAFLEGYIPHSIESVDDANHPFFAAQIEEYWVGVKPSYILSENDLLSFRPLGRKLDRDFIIDAEWQFR